MSPHSSSQPKSATSVATSSTVLGDVPGRVEGHRDGHGFVVPDNGDPLIYLAPQEMHAVLHRDRVLVRIVRVDRKGRPEGRVVEILERHKAPIIGRLLHEGGHWVVAPEDKRYGQDILIPKNATATAQVGQVVAVELTETPSLHAQPVGRVSEVLGQIDDPGMEIEIAVRKYEVPHRFSAAAQAEAAALPEKLRAADRRYRVDLSDVALVTIDGEDARDFDDAVYCEPWSEAPATPARKRGRKAAADAVPEAVSKTGWRLLVAIADVSHYVKPGEALDDDAYERATSVYFPRRVIPMLPEKLSNGLCSLNPDVDRLCMVCDMLIAADGEMHAYQFYPAVMHSKARFTYTEVAAILANTRGPEAARRATLVPHLLHLHEVYRALLKARSRRGAMDFETTETQIVCDDQGRIEKIVPRTRTEAHRLIEEAMLAANVCAASFIAQAEHASLFRVHEGPTPEKRVALQAYLRALGLGLSVSDDPAPGEFAAIAAATQGRPDAQQIHMMLLRSMQQAIYTPVNSGHFGLAYSAYTHFTSPIRRYPDLLVHRVVHSFLDITDNGRDAGGGKKRRALARALSEDPRVLDEAELIDLGRHASEREVAADGAEKDLRTFLVLQLLHEKHLGDELDGTVTGVMPNGTIFVSIDRYLVDGAVKSRDMKGGDGRTDRWTADPRSGRLIASRSGASVGIGDRIRVRIAMIDLRGRQLDLEIVKFGRAAIEVVGELPASGDAGARRLNEGEGRHFEPRPRDGRTGKTGRDKFGHKPGFKKGRRGRKG